MVENPFEVDKHKKQKNSKEKIKHDQDSINEQHESNYKSSSETWAKQIIHLLDFIAEHRWPIIIISSILLGEFATPIILIAIFAEKIKKYITDTIK